MKIDLNSDLGESFGRYHLGHDPEVIQLVSSVNIACGYHAGDPDVMAHTVQLAETAGVAIGAHPGFHDLQGFGRQRFDLPAEEIHNMVKYQIGALQAFTKTGQLHHVKPHGALYNMAGQDHDIALAICTAIQEVDPNLPIYGLAQSQLIAAAKEIGLPYAEEVFGDRNYQANGALVPRSQNNAVLTDPKAIAQRTVNMVQQQAVTAVTGEQVTLKTDTLCVHGDNGAALEIVKAIRAAFAQANIEIIRF
ncbi:LamB/YcsF family protein [Agrilactobacillus fermenti]|uniref:LamB/YcsF family protein n=1 Tax=Agrilactobacillus fermenti TaxID=2586909 RepID=UPI003A5BECB3